ncbi:MAG: bifunctional diguanylate cyclase/phosphodiesterase [Campylobacteraceae bacterium]|jgi:diguanylate cyclase (GGDEF)-like protein|nr:bifunctional diguanylate cyclase/phosphodiesterase [Campylobacteraceae bacterium]
MRRYGLSTVLSAASCIIGKIKPFCEIDDLTGVLNLRALRSDLLHVGNVAMALININSFSTINNAYGAESGDLLLKNFCNIIFKNIPDNATVYRCYGDEFAIVFKTDSILQAEEFAKQIDSCLSFLAIKIGDIELKISVSIGIAYGSKEELLKMASIALMEARISKKVFSRYVEGSELERKIQKIFYWQSRLKDALIDGHLTLFYQPLLNNHSGKIDKFESLIRLRHDGNIVLPFEFLDAAREGGLLSSVTRVIIAESFRNFSKNDYSFSVNITEQDLQDSNFIDFIEKKLELNNIDPSRVYFELLEGISADVAHNSLETLKQIKKMGCKLSVDDFGTEHSNFRRLLELEVDLIKIDGSFIKNLDKCDISRKIVRSVISFSRSIGAMTAAEFVHSKEIQNIVLDMGVDYSQGYYIGIPTSKVEIKLDEAFI